MGDDIELVDNDRQTIRKANRGLHPARLTRARVLIMLTRCRVLSLGYLESVLHREGIRQTPHHH